MTEFVPHPTQEMLAELRNKPLEERLDTLNFEGKTVVAMSGGVDSSCTAAMLVNAGVDVVGVTLLMQKDPQVPNERALSLAKETAAKLGIEHVVVDATHHFFDKVVHYFAHEYASGRTPNPCVMCNPQVKFATILSAADELGATTVVTGHYATLFTDAQGRTRLARGADNRRDQSYFLYRVTPEELARVRFPLALVEKTEVRQYASHIALPSAHEPDSQDVCFVSSNTRFDLIERYFPEALTPGDIVRADGTKVGTHNGIANYTVGQRKGLGIAHPVPFYVIGIDAEHNHVIVGEAPELEKRTFLVQDVVLHEELPKEGKEYLVQIRYRMSVQPALVKPAPQLGPRTVEVTFDAPVNAVAPGQACVWYEGDVVCGGGTIS